MVPLDDGATTGKLMEGEEKKAEYRRTRAQVVKGSSQLIIGIIVRKMPSLGN